MGISGGESRHEHTFAIVDWLILQDDGFPRSRMESHGNLMGRCQCTRYFTPVVSVYLVCFNSSYSKQIIMINSLRGANSFENGMESRPSACQATRPRRPDSRGWIASLLGCPEIMLTAMTLLVEGKQSQWPPIDIYCSTLAHRVASVLRARKDRHQHASCTLISSTAAAAVTRSPTTTSRISGYAVSLSIGDLMLSTISALRDISHCARSE